MALLRQRRCRVCWQPDNDTLQPELQNVALILIVGADAALLEGMAQALGAAGQQVLTAATLAEAAFVAAAAPPLLAVVDRVLLASVTDTRSIGLAPGGALVAFGDPGIPLAASVRRSVLAELRLPLERARLIALAAHVQDRARRTGRDVVAKTPPDSRPAL
jgi:cytochrome c551/c552